MKKIKIIRDISNVVLLILGVCIFVGALTFCNIWVFCVMYLLSICALSASIVCDVKIRRFE